MMFPQNNRHMATAASLALLLAPVAAVYPQELKDTKLRPCVANTIYSDIADMGTFWGNDAEKFADDYINANTDHSQWAQRLYRDLFPEENHSTMDCLGSGASCDFSVKCGQ
jgi:uncharacterized protein (DUF736 family)